MRGGGLAIVLLVIVLMLIGTLMFVTVNSGDSENNLAGQVGTMCASIRQAHTEELVLHGPIVTPIPVECGP